MPDGFTLTQRLYDLPPRPEAGISDVVLLSHRRHLDDLGAPRADRLLVSSDWLAWHLAVQAGHLALHFDALLVPWPDELGNPEDHHRRACEWVYDAQGQDMTMFRGISLGKQFVRSITLHGLHTGRALHGLERLMRLYRPQRLTLIDLRLKLDVLDDAGKRAITSGIASAHGATFQDRLDAPEPGDPGFPERFEGVGKPYVEAAPKRLLRHLYAMAVAFLFRLPLRPRRPSILFMLNWITARQLLDGCPKTGPVPALFAGQLPKSLAFLRHAWQQGARLLVLPEPCAAAAVQKDVEVVVERLQQAWQTPSNDPVIEARRSFVRENLIATGWLQAQAREVTRYQRLFRHNRVARVVIGDATNVTCRMIADTARQASVPVDEMLNGMFLTPQRYDARTGDSHGASAIDGLLSRGLGDERWLKRTEADLPFRRVGYPALKAKGMGMLRPKAHKRALVLPIYADGDDALAVQGYVFSHLVSVVDSLRRFGCDEIRVKLHAGPPNLPYYRDLMATLGLKADLYKDNALAMHIDWADFVTGPVNSGSFLETLALGKPYYPFQPQPSLIDPVLIEGVRVLTTAEELIDCLRNGTPVDARAILETFASASSIPDSPKAFWQAMAKAA
jgi:hypothetical protein